MWELDYKESWAPKNWCFWTVVLEKTLESLLDCKEIQPVRPKGDQSWVFFGRNDVKAKTPVLWPSHVKSWLIWKDPDGAEDWGQEKGTTEDGMVGLHRWFNGHQFGWALGVGDGQGGLACCSSWGHKESDTTEQLNWTELNYIHNVWSLASLSRSPWLDLRYYSNTNKILKCYLWLCYCYKLVILLITVRFCKLSFSEFLSQIWRIPCPQPFKYWLASLNLLHVCSANTFPPIIRCLCSGNENELK